MGDLGIPPADGCTSDITCQKTRSTGKGRAYHKAEKEGCVNGKGSLSQREDSGDVSGWMSLAERVELLGQGRDDKFAEDRDDRGKSQGYHDWADDGDSIEIVSTEIRNNLDHDEADYIIHHGSAGEDDAEASSGEAACTQDSESCAQAGRAESCACGKGLQPGCIEHRLECKR